MTLVLVTHDLGLASRCSRQVRVASGRIAADALPAERLAEAQTA
jgi:putative ABC transport system ATP-binding protein